VLESWDICTYSVKQSEVARLVWDECMRLLLRARLDEECMID
jgi:hypothetical protein